MSKKEKCEIAVALGKMRKGITEKHSEKKSNASSNNLQRAREIWAKLTPEQRRIRKEAKKMGHA